jgi:hypothetical protein
MLCWTCGVLRLNLLEYDEIKMTIEWTSILAPAYEQNLLANIPSRQQLEALPGHNVSTLRTIGAGLLGRYLVHLYAAAKLIRFWDCDDV